LEGSISLVWGHLTEDALKLKRFPSFYERVVGGDLAGFGLLLIAYAFFC
jgi:hypothetical protein